MKKCLIASMAVFLGVMSSAMAGPGDSRTWEEDFEDNLDPVVANPTDWTLRSGTNGDKINGDYVVENGMMNWDGSLGWQLMDTTPGHYFNGVTRIDMDFASNPVGDDYGVGWWISVGNNEATSGTEGQIGINLLLGRNDTDEFVQSDVIGQFVGFGARGPLTHGPNVAVADGPVSTSVTITVLGGGSGALVEYSIVDSSGDGPIVGSYTAFARTAGTWRDEGSTFTVLNYGDSIANGQGSIDDLKIVNSPGGFTDGDFDVDGADFLKWQRELGDTTNLGLWEGNFGAVPAVAAAGAVNAVPEPSSSLLLAACWCSNGVGYQLAPSSGSGSTRLNGPARFTASSHFEELPWPTQS